MISPNEFINDEFFEDNDENVFKLLIMNKVIISTSSRVVLLVLLSTRVSSATKGSILTLSLNIIVSSVLAMSIVELFSSPIPWINYLNASLTMISFISYLLHIIMVSSILYWPEVEYVKAWNCLKDIWETTYSYVTNRLFTFLIISAF